MSAHGVICPHCGCEYVFRSHLRTVEVPFLRVFHLMPYRCDAFGHCFDRRLQESNSKSRDRASSFRSAAYRIL